MNFADCIIQDKTDKRFSFARPLHEERIDPPRVTDAGSAQKKRNQILTRSLMHTGICSSLNDVVPAFRSSPEYREILDASRYNNEPLVGLDSMARKIAKRLMDLYHRQEEGLARISNPPPMVSDFLNLYTAGLTNAVKTYAALGKAAFSKLVERRSYLDRDFESAGRELISNNRHLATQLSRFSQPVFNLFLNLNGGNLPVGLEPYHLQSGNFMCARLADSHYLLPTPDFLDRLAKAANSPETVVKSYGRSGRLENENFRQSYNAKVVGCPAFKRGLASDGTVRGPAIIGAFFENMDCMIGEIVFPP